MTNLPIRHRRCLKKHRSTSLNSSCSGSGILIYVLASLVLLSGCMGLKAPAEHKDPKTFPQYWLTTSLFVGPFYDDDKLGMVDYRPFSAIDDAETLDGYTLFPKNSTATIPAGTIVQIVDISYPDAHAKLKRPIFSPRDNIWVYLRIARERGRVTVFREKIHVLVIPKKITNEQSLNGYLKRFLSNKDPNRWILQQESRLQAGIFEKRPVLGMKRQHLISALGPAIKKQFQKPGNFEEAAEIWHYYDYLITIVDDVVIRISPLSSKIRNA